MFEPPSITLTALAARWGCTPQDIAGTRPPKAPPLYFAFEGLVIDASDRWTLAGGDDATVRERDELTRKIAADEEKIKSWKRAGVAEWRKFDGFGKDIGTENAVSVRSEIRNIQTRLKALEELWEAREAGRARARFVGYLRAEPDTLDEIEMRGVASFPRFAIYAQPPFHRVALETARYPKETIGPDDLRALMDDVRTIEAGSGGVPAQQSETAPAPANLTAVEDGERPLQAMQWQEQEILRVVAGLGLVASAIPKPLPGKRGVKAEVRKQLKLSIKVFDLAWERLRADGRLADATTP